MKILILAMGYPRWNDDTIPAFVYDLSKRLKEKGFGIVVLALIADMLKRIRQNQEEILYKMKKKEYEKPDNFNF